MNNMSTAPDVNHQVRNCKIVHPFHPLFEKQIQVVTIRQNWGEYRVFYYDQDGQLTSIPACWTDTYEPDLFNIIANGRCAFRINELLQLTRLIDEYRRGNNR